MNTLTFTTVKPIHCDLIERISNPDNDPDCFSAHHLREHFRRFPEGQFVALIDGVAVGYAVTMRTNYSPYDLPRDWYDAIGDMTLCNHDPNGRWLYGVDFAVDPAYRRRGIGTQLYKARFRLVERLGLDGFYVGGMLAGYHKYAPQMSVYEYAERVTCGEIYDPTVSMQMKRGFQPMTLIENYIDDLPKWCNAMLLRWDNPAAMAMGVPIPA